MTNNTEAVRLQVEVIGDNSVAWCKHSGILRGEDAKAVREMLNNISLVRHFTFPKPNGELVVMNEQVLKRAIITVEIVNETSE